jgi:hypothetical protein
MSKRHEDAKKLVRASLNRHHISYIKLTARVVSFSDLARRDAVFVKVHGCKYPEPGLQDVANDLKGTGVLLDLIY